MERLYRSGQLGRLLLFAGFILMAIAGLSWTLTRETWQGSDFATFIEAGRRVATEQDPYTVGPEEYMAFRGVVEPVAFPNLNAPASLLAFGPLSRLDPWLTFWAWYGLGLGLYVGGVALLARTCPRHGMPTRVAWAFSLAGLWTTLQTGQVYLFLGALATGAWLLLARGRPATGGS